MVAAIQIGTRWRPLKALEEQKKNTKNSVAELAAKTIKKKKRKRIEFAVWRESKIAGTYKAALLVLPHLTIVNKNEKKVWKYVW